MLSSWFISPISANLLWLVSMHLFVWSWTSVHILWIEGLLRLVRLLGIFLCVLAAVSAVFLAQTNLDWQTAALAVEPKDDNDEYFIYAISKISFFFCCLTKTVTTTTTRITGWYGRVGLDWIGLDQTDRQTGNSRLATCAAYSDFLERREKMTHKYAAIFTECLSYFIWHIKKLRYDRQTDLAPKKKSVNHHRDENLDIFF